MYGIVQTAYNSMPERNGQYCSKLVICPLLSPKYVYQFLVMCAKERKGVCICVCVLGIEFRSSCLCDEHLTL